MEELITDQIMQKIIHADELYYRLIILVAPAGSGKTAILQGIQEQKSYQLVNINLELSRRMLELTERQRALQLPRLLSEIVNAPVGDVVLLDNIELLFDVSLKQDPLRLIQGLSRNRTLVVAWNGSVNSGHLTYAMPEHPEYRRYVISDFMIVSPDITG